MDFTSISVPYVIKCLSLERAFMSISIPTPACVVTHVISAAISLSITAHCITMSKASTWSHFSSKPHCAIHVLDVTDGSSFAACLQGISSQTQITAPKTSTNSNSIVSQPTSGQTGHYFIGDVHKHYVSLHCVCALLNF